MTAIAINDLNIEALDAKELGDVAGAGNTWQLLSRRIYTGAWSAYRQFYSRYYGTVLQHGKYHVRFLKGFTRRRMQTEVTYWFNFVD